MQVRKPYATADFSTVSHVIRTGTTFWTLPHSLFCTLHTGDCTSAIGTMEHVHRAVERQVADRFAKHRAQWPVEHTTDKLYSPYTLAGWANMPSGGVVASTSILLKSVASTCASTCCYQCEKLCILTFRPRNPRN
jgi:hypothetical protein